MQFSKLIAGINIAERLMLIALCWLAVESPRALYVASAWHLLMLLAMVTIVLRTLQEERRFRDDAGAVAGAHAPIPAVPPYVLEMQREHEAKEHGAQALMLLGAWTQHTPETAESEALQRQALIVSSQMVRRARDLRGLNDER